MKTLIDAVTQSIGMLGSDLPAYKALFDQILTTMHSSDQAVLKRTYDDAMAAANRAHAAAQEN